MLTGDNSPAAKSARDVAYNFDCPGCRKRRNARRSRVLSFPPYLPDEAPIRVRYCRACADAIEALPPPEPDSMPRMRSLDINGDCSRGP